MATHDEMFELTDAALHALRAALELGDRAGYQQAWRSQTWDDHCFHAAVHIDDARRSNNAAFIKQQLQQALCRIAMALVQHGV